ncbi:MAG: hypothetical protein KDK36_00825 [Leptospiraceae bacterium]|nr:hypothetical protein [Leptospiraceae bacterium]
MKPTIPDTLIDPKIEGNIIFCFKKIRNVPLIELRNGLDEEVEDGSILFYLQYLENSIITNNIDLQLFERVKKIKNFYMEYKIHYLLSDELEINNEIKSNYN